MDAKINLLEFINRPNFRVSDTSLSYRQIHIEAMREKYRMGAERRVELFGKQLDAIEGELGKRDLTAVPTERLFDLVVKFGKELNTTDTPLHLGKRVDGLHIDLSNTVKRKT